MSHCHEPSTTEIRTATGDTAAPGHGHVDVLAQLNGGDRARVSWPWSPMGVSWPIARFARPAPPRWVRRVDGSSTPPMCPKQGRQTPSDSEGWRCSTAALASRSGRRTVRRWSSWPRPMSHLLRVDLFGTSPSPRLMARCGSSTRCLCQSRTPRTPTTCSACAPHGSAPRGSSMLAGSAKAGVFGAPTLAGAARPCRSCGTGRTANSAGPSPATA